MKALGIVYVDGAYKLKSGQMVKGYEEAKKIAFMDIEGAAYISSEEVFNEHQARIAIIPVVSVDVLPPNAKYQMIDMISFQSTLGTGFFSEFGSDISNIFGTEAKMMNKKIGTSIEKCKHALRFMAYQLGANAVIGTDFDLSTNTRDATTVAAQGTAIYVENIDEVFKFATTHVPKP
jgi:uncharacterized protein YbjQ (UPF0145 family)